MKKRASLHHSKTNWSDLDYTNPKSGPFENWSIRKPDHSTVGHNLNSGKPDSPVFGW
jgi:hypothetical protein